MKRRMVSVVLVGALGGWSIAAGSRWSAALALGLLTGIGMRAAWEIQDGQTKIEALIRTLDPLLEQAKQTAAERAAQVDDAVQVYRTARGGLMIQGSDGTWVARELQLRFLPIGCATTIVLDDEEGSEIRLRVFSHDKDGFPLLEPDSTGEIA